MQKQQFIFLVLALGLCACQHRSNGTGAKVVPPQDYIIYNPYIKVTDTLAALPRAPKVYTLVDVSCSTCILRLSEWDKFQKEIGNKVHVYPVCFSKDKFELLKYLFENNQLARIRLPLLLDKKEKFIRDNKKQIGVNGEFNVLTDDNDNIILSGDPIGDQAVRKKFIEQIRQL